MFDVKKFTKPLLAAAIALALPVSAHALTVKFQSGASVLIVNDGDGNDFNANANAINFSGTLGAFDINLSGSTATDSAGASELSSVALDITGVGDLKVWVSHAGYTGAIGSPSSSGFSFDINGVKLGGELLAASYVDSSNTLFGMGDQIGADANFNNPDAGTTAGNNYDWANTELDSGVLGGPFAITTLIDLTQVSGGKTSFDATTLAVVPIPAAGFLLLGALGGLGFVGRRRRKTA